MRGFDTYGNISRHAVSPIISDRGVIWQFVGAMLVFFWAFRPQVLHPLGSLALVPAAGGVAVFISYPTVARRVWRSLGAGFFFLLAFILAWSLLIDISTNAFSRVGASSQFFAAIRLLVTLFGAVFVIGAICRWEFWRFRRLILLSITAQIMLAFMMISWPEFKSFMYLVVSGYSGSEKIFRSHFILSRGFGWSEELFYLMPVAMVFATALFMKKIDLRNMVFLAVIVIVALFNARLGVLGLIAGLFVRFGFRASVPSVVVLIVFFTVASLTALPAFDLVLADIDDGRSRTLDALLSSHIHFPSQVDQWVLGAHKYLYADSQRNLVSDIGWIIILNYGGIVYAIAWGALMIIICIKAFPRRFDALVVLGMVVLAGFKGLVFSGNALIAVLLALALLGGYRKNRQKLNGYQFSSQSLCQVGTKKA